MIRARSFRRFRMSIWLSREYADRFIRRRKISSRNSVSLCRNSSTARSWISFFFFMAASCLPRHELRLQRELVRGEAKGLPRGRLVHPLDLIEHEARSHHANPLFGRPFSLAHAGFGGLLGDGLVGEYPDPDLPAPLYESRHRDTGGLDLAGGDPTRRGSLHSVVPEVEGVPRLGRSPSPTLLRLPEFHPFRRKHAHVLLFAHGLAGGGRQHLPLVDPDLHSDLPVGGFRLGEPVLDVRPQSMEGNPTLPVPLGAGHFGSSQPSGHVDLDPLGAELHRGNNGLFHRPPEG